jgi:hypothetical protein
VPTHSMTRITGALSDLTNGKVDLQQHWIGQQYMVKS